MAEISQPVAGTAQSRLIEAGLDVFGACGYTAATTRMIAERGRVNLAAIPYHFGGKEGLYLAVIDHIVLTVNGQLAPRLNSIRERLQEEAVARDEAMAMLEDLLGALIDFVVGADQALRFSRIVLREQLSPSKAYHRIYDGIMQPVQEAVASLLALICGESASSRILRLRTFSLVGQIMAFRSGRETLIRFVDMVGYTLEETAEIRCMLLEQTRAALSCLAPAAMADEREV